MSEPRERPPWWPQFPSADNAGRDVNNAGRDVNSAGRDINYGVQAENIFGDVTYLVGPDDPPEKKFTVAKNYIAGGRLRAAEELIGDVVAAEFVSAELPSSLTNEVAYYWTLSVLGDRSFELLDKEQFDELAQARQLARGGPQDQWSSAHAVLTDLVEVLWAQEESGTISGERIDRFLDGFERLAAVHREEIRRHLDLILSGMLQDRLAAHDAEMVAAARRGDAREERVWKYFEPVPAEPLRVPAHWPALELTQWTMVLWGAVLGVAGLVVAELLVISLSWRTALLSGACIIVSGVFVGYAAPGLFPARYAPSPRDPKASRGRTWSRERVRFADHVHETVRRQYDKRAPSTPGPRLKWAAATRHARAARATEIIELYGDSGIAPARIDWLIAWHADEDERRWLAGESGTSRRLLMGAILAAGAAGQLAGWFFVLTRMQDAHPSVANVALLWLAAGAVLLGWGRADVHVVRRYTHRNWQAAFEERHHREWVAYRLRRSLLNDRPADAEMARWLDFDKLYLKSLAMNQYGLGDRDVIAHAFLDEGAGPCRTMKVAGGPPRFSAYTLRVFLLTDAGVRQMSVHLDFPTGIVKDQGRIAFRYDALTSARGVEVGIRFDEGRREHLLPGTGGARRRGGPAERGEAGAGPQGGSFLRRQKFRLSLVNGQYIEVELQSQEEALLRRKSGTADAPTSEIPETSEMTGALSILEAVAADGGEWIARARARRRNAPADPGGRPLSLPWPRREGLGGAPAEPPAAPYEPWASPPPRQGRPGEGNRS